MSVDCACVRMQLNWLLILPEEVSFAGSSGDVAFFGASGVAVGDVVPAAVALVPVAFCAGLELAGAEGVELGFADEDAFDTEDVAIVHDLSQLEEEPARGIGHLPSALGSNGLATA